MGGRNKGSSLVSSYRCLSTKDCPRSWMYVKTLNQLPGSYFSYYLKTMADHQTPLNPAYPWIFQAGAHNQSRSSKYTYPKTVAHVFLPPLSRANVNYFKTTLHISSPNSLHKRASPIQGWQPCLCSPPSPAAGGLDLALTLASILFHRPFLPE